MLGQTSKLIAVFLLFLVVSGCATKMSDFASEDSQTMQDIYNGTFNNRPGEQVQSVSNDSAQRIIKDGVEDLRGYTRDANNEVSVLFKRISNPTLVGYVYPHLTKDNIPIPAYSIPFRMSPEDYYAMPGEDRGFE